MALITQHIINTGQRRQRWCGILVNQLTVDILTLVVRQSASIIQINGHICREAFRLQIYIRILTTLCTAVTKF